MTPKQFLSAAMPGLAAVLTITAIVSSRPGRQDSGSIEADSAFIQEAAAGGLMEVALGKVAQQKAASPEVKQFGHRMVTDHSKADQQLATLAQMGDVDPPAILDRRRQRDVDAVSSRSGKDFDRAYMRSMVRNHAENVVKFQDEAMWATSQEVQEFASKTLPTLKDHLRMATQLASRVGDGSSAETTSVR